MAPMLTRISWSSGPLTTSFGPLQPLLGFGRSGTVRLVLSSGEVLEAPLSKALSSSDNWQPLLTVLDLASAHKQFAIHPSCRNTRLWLKRPGTNAAQCFEGLVLPFGSTASVVHFNRVSKLLRSIGFRLNLLWGEFLR